MPGTLPTVRIEKGRGAEEALAGERAKVERQVEELVSPDAPMDPAAQFGASARESARALGSLTRGRPMEMVASKGASLAASVAPFMPAVTEATGKGISALELVAMWVTARVTYYTLFTDRPIDFLIERSKKYKVAAYLVGAYAIYDPGFFTPERAQKLFEAAGSSGKICWAIAHLIIKSEQPSHFTTKALSALIVAARDNFEAGRVIIGLSAVKASFFKEEHIPLLKEGAKKNWQLASVLGGLATWRPDLARQAAQALAEAAEVNHGIGPELAVVRMMRPELLDRP